MAPLPIRTVPWLVANTPVPPKLSDPTVWVTPLDNSNIAGPAALATNIGTAAASRLEAARRRTPPLTW